MVEANAGRLVSRDQVETGLARSAQALLKRLQSRFASQLYERTQKALNKAELSNEYKAKFMQLWEAFGFDAPNEGRARDQLVQLRMEYFELAQIDGRMHQDAIDQINRIHPFRDAIKAEKVFWEMESMQLTQDLLSLESRLVFDERVESAFFSPQDTIGRPVAMAFPDLVRIPIYEIGGRDHAFEFAWPQPGQVDPSIFQEGVRVSQLKFITCNHQRGVQVKLSNGILSPIFEHSNASGPQRYTTTEVAKGQICKVRAGACRPDAKVLKCLTLYGENDLVMAHVESARDVGLNYEVDVPPELTLVGVYGNFGLSAAKNAGIFGLGLIFYKRDQ